MPRKVPAIAQLFARQRADDENGAAVDGVAQIPTLNPSKFHGGIFIFFFIRSIFFCMLDTHEFDPRTIIAQERYMCDLGSPQTNWFFRENASVNTWFNPEVLSRVGSLARELALAECLFRARDRIVLFF